MNTLLLVSTKQEIQPILNQLNSKTKQHFFALTNSVDCLVGGIGLLSTAFELTKLLQFKTYDRVIQVGVAGSFKKDVELGTLVEVTQEQYGDVGAENNNGEFLSLQDLQLPINSIFKNDTIVNNQPISNLPKVSGITVNLVSGSAATIQKRRAIFNADVETMEGLALFYTCTKLNIPYAQIRSISNFIEPRNKDNWKLPLAITNLNNWITTNIL